MMEKELDNKIYNLKFNITEINNKIDYIEENSMSQVYNLGEVYSTIRILENTTNNNIQYYVKEINNGVTKVDDKTEEIKYKFYSFILQSFNITNIGSVKLLGDHKAIFPSGNIITATYQKFIIYDSNFNIIQIINYKYIYATSYVDIYDENNFVSGNDFDIITWIKNYNDFSINKIIKGAHCKSVEQVIYNSKGNLISYSWDGFIKIWELKNEEYKNIVTFNHLKKLTLFII